MKRRSAVAGQIDGLTVGTLSVHVEDGVAVDLVAAAEAILLARGGVEEAEVRTSVVAVNSQIAPHAAGEAEKNSR